MTAMLILSGQTPIGEGGHRFVYRHPQNPDAVVKVTKDSYWSWRKTSKSFRLFWHPKKYYDPGRREYQFYLHSVARNREAVLRHTAKCYRIVQTDKGDAVMSEMLRGADGLPAPNLPDYIRQEEEISSRLADEIRSFLRAFRDPGWHDMDYLWTNLLVAENGGGIRIVHCEHKYNPTIRFKLKSRRRRRIEKMIREDLIPFFARYGFSE